MSPTLNFAAVKLVNRVLSDYSLAREQLALHAGKVIAASLGPLDCRLRITADGQVEMIGEGSDTRLDASFHIPLSLLPRLAQKDAAAFRQVAFSGDSEFAALLAALARDLEWDVEEDLSKIMGDIAAHRLVGGIKRTHAWQQEATQRFTENVAEYLTDESRAFVARNELELWSVANETLRDDVARLEARFRKLAAGA